ncbi:MAG: hypothetical protein SP1CHLAM54_00620 [Chlamydiia bacterium]|nr:hypothetical protein [Chlamydiia bacterium]MCH9614984.1 hypothetical protein [Chlamydiia bacterium]MCH9629966.1 hypothetical protein [Chlamydiia bacterium]
MALPPVRTPIEVLSNSVVEMLGPPDAPKAFDAVGHMGPGAAVARLAAELEVFQPHIAAITGTGAKVQAGATLDRIASFVDVCNEAKRTGLNINMCTLPEITARLILALDNRVAVLEGAGA